MRSDKPASSKFKRVSTDFPNLAVLTKSATPGEIHATYVHVSVGNNSLGETVTAFYLTGSLKAPTVFLVDIEHAFAGDGNKICLLTTEVLLLAATGKLAKSKKLREWTSRNAVLLLTFLTEIALTNGETAAEALLNIFSKRINKQEADNFAEESDTEK